MSSAGVKAMLIFLLACQKSEPAPEDLDGLLHWFWSEYREGEDESLGEAVLSGLELTAELEKPETGTFSDISLEELEGYDIPEGADPSITRGMYLMNVLPCTIEQIENILIYPAQEELFDSYNSYERSFTSSEEDYQSGAVHTLDWDTEYTATLSIYGEYREFVRSGVRRVPGTEAIDQMFMLSHTWMHKPSEFEQEGKVFDQDYQIEIYIEREPGEVVHLYGIWRHMDFGAGLTTDDNFVVSITLSELVSWDKNIQTLCEEDRP
jgi:hypothetical protein